MRYQYFTSAAVLGLTAFAALAQSPSPDPNMGARPGHEIGIGDSMPKSDKASNINGSDARSEVAPTLPRTGLGQNSAVRDYLTNARASLVAGRSGQAQQSLEMAETRALDGSVLQGETMTPSSNPLVGQIRDARHALGSGDNAHAIQFIDVALGL